MCLQYELQDPLEVLQSAPPKQQWKAAVSRQVNAFWRTKLLLAAEELPSLAHLRLTHMSLSRPSPLLTSCSASQNEVQKATVQLRMASGRYRTCWLRRYWSGDPTGRCQVPGCAPDTPGTLVHLATGQCQALTAASGEAAASWAKYSSSRPYILPLLESAANSDPQVFLAFLLNPSTHPSVLALAQLHGNQVVDEVCHLSRSWLYALHCARYRALGLWQYL